jgi:hypothetical protein
MLVMDVIGPSQWLSWAHFSAGLANRVIQHEARRNRNVDAIAVNLSLAFSFTGLSHGFL